MATGEEINTRIASLDLEQRKMLADAVDVLSQCFGDGQGRAIIVFVPPNVDIAQTFVMNCAEHEAWAMASFVKDQMEAIMTKDMPSKERLN